tara:strand:- start:7639 stop:9477 length:1839 start_codon:yes stop_codon:yes gene_type:complete
MKLTQVLGQLNQIEKSKFVNVIDRIFQTVDDKDKKLAATVSRIDGQLKTATSNEITQLFNAVRSHFLFDLKENLAMSGAELSLLVKILSRDGNSVARQSWLETLFLREHARLNRRSKELLNEINDGGSLTVRSKYLQIYKDCFEVAYRNDEKFNREAKVSQDERLILNCLASHLELTREETSALENLICPTSDKGIEDMMAKLRDYGVAFISKRQGKVFVPDEVVKMLNEIQDKVLADKHQIRIFRSLSDPELSNISKAHGAPIRGVSREDKISHALQLGIPIQSILSKDIHDQGATQNQRKERIKVMLDDLELNVEKLGTTLEERIEILVDALNNAELEEFDSLSMSGFKDLLDCLSDTKPSISQRLQDTFEIEPVETIDTELLRALSISPVDILYAYTNDEIKVLRNNMNLPKRINPRTAILESFASATDKLVENYVSLAARDLKALDAAGIQIKEAELGAKFEEVTRVLLEQLGLDVDEDLRKDINTAKDKADIIISLTDDDVIVGEAKSFKNGEFAKYSSTSRQVKAYAARCESQGKRVMQVLIVAPAFSSDFISSAEMDTDINISLLEAEGLKKIVDAFKARRNPKFSDKLLTKGGLLKSDLIAKSI